MILMEATLTGRLRAVLRIFTGVCATDAQWSWCGGRPVTPVCAAWASERRSGWLPGAMVGPTSTSATSPRVDTTRHTEVSRESLPTNAGAVLAVPSVR